MEWEGDKECIGEEIVGAGDCSLPEPSPRQRGAKGVRERTSNLHEKVVSVAEKQTVTYLQRLQGDSKGKRVPRIRDAIFVAYVDAADRNLQLQMQQHVRRYE